MLRVKLLVPRTGPRTVERHGPAEKLQNVCDHPLTLVTAPAGYGKTTAVAGFLAGAGITHAWLSLDPQDNDPVRFWRCLAAAALFPKPGGDLPVSREMIESNIFAGLLIDRLHATPGHVVLVLDDFHLIHDALVRESLVCFVKHMPCRFHMIILGRENGQLTADQGQILRLDRADLAFDAGEIAEFYERRNIHLSPGEVSVVEAGTGGWAAGLLIAYHAIVGSGNVQEAVNRFSARRHIAGLVEEEVFDRWPEEVKAFLIHTSVCHTLCGPLGRAVTGREDSAALLRRLAQRDGFLVPLGEHDQWFRCHHLLADCLKTRLEREDPSLVRSLYGRAGQWLQDNGFTREAIDALIKARDYGQALALLGGVYPAMARAGEYAPLFQWLGAIPEDYYANNISLGAVHAWVLSAAGRLEAAAERINRVEACCNRFVDDEGTSEPVIHRRYWSGGPDDGKAGQYLGAQLALVRAEIAVRRMKTAEAAGYYARACKFELPGPILNYGMNPGQPSMLKTVYGFYGRLKAIDEVFSPLAGCLPRLFGKNAAYITVLLIESLYERNKLKDAYDMVMQSLEDVLSLNDPGVIVPFFVIIAKIMRAKGDLAGALNTIGEGKKRLPCQGKSYWEYLFDLSAAGLHLHNHDVQGAAEWMDPGRIGIPDHISSLREGEYLLLARYLYLAGRHEEAFRLLGRLAAFTQAAGRLGSRIEVLGLTAVSYYLEKDTAKAVAALDQALELGFPHGYARTFIDQPGPVAGLLAAYLERGGRTEVDDRYRYVRTLFRLATGSAVIKGKGADRQRCGTHPGKTIPNRNHWENS